MNHPNYFSRLSQEKEATFLTAVKLLNKWLDDLLLSGITALQKDADKLKEISSRMVDAGLPGIGKKLRLIPEKIQKTKAWTDYVINQIGEFYLFIKLTERIDQLNDLEKEDLLSYAGVPFKKTDFKEEFYLKDDWIYVGKVWEKEEKLTIIRNWFYGLKSEKIILNIEYQFNRLIPVKHYKSGMIYSTTVQFYPSSIFQRVRDVSNEQITKRDEKYFRALSLEAALDDYSHVINANPLIRCTCFLLKGLHFAQQDGLWMVSGSGDQWLRLEITEDKLPVLLSFAGAKNVIYAVEYFENAIHIFSVLLDDYVIAV